MPRKPQMTYTIRSDVHTVVDAGTPESGKNILCEELHKEGTSGKVLVDPISATAVAPPFNIKPFKTIEWDL